MDQRNQKDRRRASRERAFPLKDKGGQWVSEERRLLKDRRMNGIEEAEWADKSAETVPAPGSS